MTILFMLSMSTSMSLIVVTRILWNIKMTISYTIYASVEVIFIEWLAEFSTYMVFNVQRYF